MNAVILNYHDDLVKVRTDVGIFEGVWCSDQPTEYMHYDLELACDDVIEQDELQYSRVSTPFINNDENGVIINCLLEEIEDCVMFLRLFGDLLMLEISPSSSFSRYIGHYVRIRLSNIQMYAI